MRWPVTLQSSHGRVNCLRIENQLVIEAESPEGQDFGLGWVHSFFRSRTCFLTRALFQGRLSELLPPQPELLELDRFFRIWKFDAQEDAENAALDDNTRKRLKAYAAGFNEEQAARKKHPRKKNDLSAPPWQKEDSILLARTFGFSSWWETRGRLVFLLLRLVRKDVSWERLRELIPELGDENDRTLWKALNLPTPLSEKAEAFLSFLTRWRPGSAWIQGGRFTASGFPLLAAHYVTDVSTTPSPFIPVYLRGDAETKGFTVAGFPGFLSGRTKTLAWHLTPTWDDVVDFKIQQVREHSYRLGNDWPALQGRDEEILVGDRALHRETCYDLPTGTLLERPKKDGFYLSVRWAGQKATGTLGFLLKLPQTQSSEEAAAILAGQGSATLDGLVADKDGRIARFKMGQRFERSRPCGAWLPEKGFETSPESLVSLETMQAATVIDPEGGRLILEPGPAVKAELLSQTLPTLNRTRAEDFQNLLNDLHPVEAPKLLSVLRFLLPETDLGMKLRLWTGDWKDSLECRTLAALQRGLLEVFWDELMQDPDLYPDLRTTSPAFGLLSPAIDRLLLAPHSAWLPARDKNHRFLKSVRATIDEFQKSLTEKSREKSTEGGTGFQPWPIVENYGQKTFAPIHEDERPGHRTSFFSSSSESLGGMERAFLNSAALTIDLGKESFRYRLWGEWDEDDRTGLWDDEEDFKFLTL